MSEDVVTTSSIPNPLRVLGLARILAGGWFIATGVGMLRHYRDLWPQAARIFGADIGATDAPIRSLVTLIAGPVLVTIGLVVGAKGIAWLRRVAVPPDGPAAIDPDEVVATLRRHELPAYADGPAGPYRPLQRWLADDLPRLTWWRRDLLSSGVRTFVRSCGLALVLALSCGAVALLTTDDLLGPFPASFVFLLPLVAAIRAALVLTLIPSGGPRAESVEFPLAVPPGPGGELPRERIIESRPRLLGHEPPALGLGLGIGGVAVQCLMLSWWNLPYVGYPLLATSIIRDAASIAGGVVFFVLGHQMVATGAALLPNLQFDSVLVLIERTDHDGFVRAAEVRTESRGLTGPRRVLAAVGGPYVLDAAHRLVQAVSLAERTP